MAINKILSNNPIKYASAIARNAGPGTFFSIYRNSFPSGNVIDISGINQQMAPQHASWGLGTGYTASTTGSRIFFADTIGYGLNSCTVVNRGPNNLYVAFNLTGWVVDNAISIKTDESIRIDNSIVESVWVASVTGVCTVDGHGVQNIMKGAI